MTLIHIIVLKLAADDRSLLMSFHITTRLDETYDMDKNASAIERAKNELLGLISIYIRCRIPIPDQ